MIFALIIMIPVFVMIMTAFKIARRYRHRTAQGDLQTRPGRICLLVHRSVHDFDDLEVEAQLNSEDLGIDG